MAFHARDGWFFLRNDDGSVTIALIPPPHDFADWDAAVRRAETQVTLDADSWASVVASVSRGGEQCGRFYTARRFHDWHPCCVHGGSDEGTQHACCKHASTDAEKGSIKQRLIADADSADAWETPIGIARDAIAFVTTAANGYTATNWRWEIYKLATESDGVGLMRYRQITKL